jgi:ribonucleotide reductase alpha subunit
MTNTEEELYIIKRDGTKEVLSFDKILRRVKALGTIETNTEGTKTKLNVNYSQLVMKVVDQLYNNMPTYIIDELTAEQCTSLITKHPDYGTLASRIIVSNNHKNTTPLFHKAMEALYNFQDVHGVHSPLIHKDIWTLSQAHSEFFQSFLDYSRDYLLDYFGFKTLERAYLMKIDKKIIERPQHMWLRVALGIHGGDLPRVKETYELISQKYFTHATPTLFNAGTNHPQLSSCYLLAMEDDSVDGIYNTLKDCAKISKWAGGIGLHVHNVRAAGTHINGTNGVSNGLSPMLRVFNTTARYIDQGGGRRAGSFAIYLEPWHADIEAFLDMKKNHGDEEMRARDLFYSLWIPDLFMEKVKKDEDWALFCPHKCPGLADCYGAAFNTLYEKYRAEGKANKIVKARTLWFKILDSQMETGTPYLLYKDQANKKSNQQNLGVIKSSNLCVAPETQILTDKGYFEIKSLEGKTVNVWNGEEFSETTVHKTGTDQELITIETSDGCSLDCTPYHKFYIKKDEAKGSALLNPLEPQLEPQLKNQARNPLITPTASGIAPRLQAELPPTASGIAPRLQAELPPTASGIAPRLQAELPPTASGIAGIAIAADQLKENDILIHCTFPIVEGKKLYPFSTDIVPLNSDLKTKMQWLSSYFNSEIYKSNIIADMLYISHPERDFAVEVKLMLQLCGINAQLVFDNVKFTVITAVNKLTKLGFNPSRVNITESKKAGEKEEEKEEEKEKKVFINKIIKTGRIADTYCFNEPKKHAGIFNGIITGQCAEIIEYSDAEQTAVCNLASLGLAKFVSLADKTFDYTKLHEVVKVVTYNLNKVIDVNFYPTDKTRISNLLHRPIGLGVQGLADVFILLDIAFTSQEAREVNKLIFETIYHAALECSMEMAKARSEKMRELAKYQHTIFSDVHVPDLENFSKLESVSRAYCKQGESDEWVQELLPIPAEFYYLNKNRMGAYSSFEGSPASKGLLQFDLWEVQPASERYDWSTLKTQIQEYGLRNSLLVALMPTASTSQILGSNECFEPFTSNLYSRRTNAGEFVLPNKYLMAELIELGLWNEALKDNIILNKGSIQQLSGVSDHLKEKYKTVWEIPMKQLIDMAAERGPYICQSQSLNLWLEDPDYKSLTAMHFYAWQAGLKTGIYYLRRKAKHQAQQFTIRPPQQQPGQQEDCLMCSS